MNDIQDNTFTIDNEFRKNIKSFEASSHTNGTEKITRRLTETEFLSLFSLSS